MRKLLLISVTALIAASPSQAKSLKWMDASGAGLPKGSQMAVLSGDPGKAGGFKVGNKTYKLQLIALDTRGEPKEATVQLKRLVEVDQAKFIFGPFLSNVFLAVRPYVHTDHYWQVYFDTNKVIRDTFGAAGYPVPEQHFVIRNQS